MDPIRAECQPVFLSDVFFRLHRIHFSGGDESLPAEWFAVATAPAIDAATGSHYPHLNISINSIQPVCQLVVVHFRLFLILLAARLHRPFVDVHQSECRPIIPLDVPFCSFPCPSIGRLFRFAWSSFSWAPRWLSTPRRGLNDAAS